MDLSIIENARSISIVGNATSILSLNFGKAIDSAEVVLRMNCGFPKSQIAQGSRTDFLMFSVWDIYKASNYAMPLNRMAHISIQDRQRSEKNGVINFYPADLRAALFEKLGASPSVGCSTLDWLSNFYTGEVNVYGYDFKKTTSFYQRFQHIGHHNYRAEQKYVTELCNRKGWNYDACKNSR